MAGRRPKKVELDPSDLMNKSVKEIDTQLEAIWGYAAMALGIREHKAANEKIDTPPPAPPRIDGQRISQGSFNSHVQVKSARRTPNTLPEKPPKQVTLIAGSSSHCAFSIIDRYPRGVDLPIYREEFDKMYGGKDDPSAHSKAISRLKQSGHVISYRKRLFSYNRLKQFLQDVAAGVAEDIPGEQPALNGKWAIACYHYISSLNGAWADFGEIVDHVVRQPGFENAANARSLVAVALRTLQIRHNSIEKKKKGLYSQYRLKVNLNEGPQAEIEASTTAH